MLLEKLLQLLGGWAPAFCQWRTRERAIALALGLLCGLGRRTVTRAICFNNRQHQDWTADYKFFNRSRWDPHDLFEPIIQTAVGQYCPKHIVVGFDDTGIKRTGKKIKTAYWQRDPLSPPFHVNLMFGQRFLQASLLAPLYHFDRESSPRGLPIRFAEVTPVRKPGKTATPEQKAAYRQAKKTHNLSTAFVEVQREVRQDFDSQGFTDKVLIAVGDSSFCNKTTFRQPLDRTILITRARKDLRLCFPHQGPGRRYYDTELFSPEEVYHDTSIPWKETKIFHGSKFRRIRFKEVSQVLWQRGGGRRLLRLFVLAPTPYRKTKEGRLYYRQKAYLLCDDHILAAKELLQAYFDRWQIEINHRDEKSILGVGQAQVWADLSVPRVPALMVATYSLMLLSALETYGPKRTTAYEALPQWRRAARRPSCLDLVTLLRKQIEAQPLCQGSPTNILGYPSMVQTAAA
jgi:DDE superfamily endonuclease